MGLKTRKSKRLQPKAVKWVGDAINSITGEKGQKKVYYSGFEVNSLKIMKDDAVFVKMRGSVDNAGFEEYDLARVLDCYENISGKSTLYNAKIEFYAPVGRCLKARQKSIDYLDVPPINKEFEVFKQNAQYDIDIRLIMGKCWISEVDIGDNPSEVRFPKDCDGEFYVCRFQISEKLTRLTPLKAKPQSSLSTTTMKNNRTTVRRSLASDLNAASPQSKKALGSKTEVEKAVAASNSLCTKHNVSKELTVMLNKLDSTTLSFYNKENKRKSLATYDANASPLKKTKQMDEKYSSVDSPITRRSRRVLGEADENKIVENSPLKNKKLSKKSILSDQINESLSNGAHSDNSKYVSKVRHVRGLNKNQIEDLFVISDDDLLFDDSDDDFKSSTCSKSKKKGNMLDNMYNTPKRKVSSQIKSKSTIKKKYICSHCLEKFYNKTELLDHVDDEHQQEKENVIKPKAKTPKRSYKMATPKNTTSRKILNTPILKDRVNPIKSQDTPLEKARSRLHVSAVPDSLPCRDEEFDEIYSFIEGKLLDGTGGCMFVSGVPGTGKTLTVREVVKVLTECQKQGDLPSFKFLELNAMKLTEPHQLWIHIWKGLTGQKVTASHASNLLQTRFSSSSARREATLLLVDELDMLVTRKQDVMYNLFDWPTRSGSKLIVVAIANTMDLPERVMMNRVSSRLGLTRRTFQPYTYEQLQTIVTSRLQGIRGFDPDGIQLVSRKVAALSGDARRALDICRRATEIAESGNVKLSPSKSPSKQKVLVGIMHVDQAIQEMFMSPKITAIRSCSQFQQYLLQAIVAEFIRTGVEEARLPRVIEQLHTISRLQGKEVLCNSEIMIILGHLSSQRILLCEHGKTDLLMRIRLNCSTDDVNYALRPR